MSKYLHISSSDLTAAVMSALADLGVAHGAPTTARSPSRRGGSQTKHLVRIPLDLGMQLPDGLTATIGFFNSYRGESSLKLFGGAIRSVCANGCIFGTPDFCVSIRHVDGPKARAFLGAIRSAVMQIVAALRERLSAEVARLQSLTVASPVLTIQAAVNAGVITRSAAERARFVVTHNEAVGRPEDPPDTVWGLYNILNEATRRTGRSERAALLRDPGILAFLVAGVAA